jgi:hypothetical protein
MMCSQNAHEGSQAILSALIATTLAVAKFLNSVCELLFLEFGCLFVELVACEKLIDRVDAAGFVNLRLPKAER